MDEASDKRSDMAGKTGGGSANLEESLKGEGVAADLDLEVDGVNLEEPTIEGLLKENQELNATVEEQSEDIRKFQERQITLLELSEALRVTVKGLGGRIKKLQGAAGIKGAEFGGPIEFKLTKSELAELLRLVEEMEMTDDELKKSVVHVTDVRQGIETQIVKMGSEPSNTCGIFPEEVWEQILEAVEDSNDVLNVFNAFPYLEGRVLKNKYGWLFDQVVPHLRPWLNNKQLLSCRLVSRKWAHAVDNHLENLPFRVAVDPRRPITGQVWYPEGSRAHEIYKLRANHNRGCEVSFRNLEQLTQFLRDVDKHPPARNPFLGRAVKIWGGSRWEDDKVAYFRAAIEILRKCGHHVWFLDFSYFGNNFYEHVGQFGDIISLVPNLKAMKFQGSINCNGYQYQQLSHPLSKLKSLDVSFAYYLSHAVLIPRNFVNSAQIQRLCITQQWIGEYGTLFPELRELTLDHVNYPDQVFNQLTSLNAPILSKLCIDVKFGKYRYDCVSMTLADILSWVKIFPSLQQYEVRVTDPDQFGEEDVEGQPVFDSVPSIKSLSISWKDVHLLGLSFLRCFPSLEYAKINKLYYREYNDMEVFRPDSAQYMKVYRWGLWEEIPSLKEINFDSVPYARPPIPSHYNRTRYEWLKKKRERLLRDEELQDRIEGFRSMVFSTCEDEDDSLADEIKFDGEN